MQISTLRPGLLVHLSTQITGNVSYVRTELEAPRLTDGGALLARWETESVTKDPKEQERAKTARGKARSTITGVCSISGAFGLLCPDALEPELKDRVGKARAIADEFNASARYTRLEVYVMCGRIAPDDAEAVRSINSDVRRLLERMEDGVRNLDAAAIRKAANAARSIGAMLSSEAVSRVASAIQAARGAARQIAKSGEQAAAVVDQAAIRRIAEQRLAFLDLDEAAEIAKPEAGGRAVDLEVNPVEVQRKLSAALLEFGPPEYDTAREAAEGYGNQYEGEPAAFGELISADYPPEVRAGLFSDEGEAA